MTTTDPAGADLAGVDSGVSHRLTFDKEQSDRGVAMSEPQYERIQNRIHHEVGRGSATSIWLALAFAFVGFGTTLMLTLATLDPKVVSPTTKGRLQGLLIGAAAVAGLCLVMHLGKWMRDRRIGHDICHEMDIYCHRVAQARRRWWTRSASPPAATPSTSLPLDLPLRVLRATYGDGNRDIDSTEVLNRLIVDGQLDFVADNATIGNDPAPGAGKILRLTYSVRGEEFNSSFAEGTHVVLP
jgi:hypothetical protein